MKRAFIALTRLVLHITASILNSLSLSTIQTQHYFSETNHWFADLRVGKHSLKAIELIENEPSLATLKGK